MEGNHHAPCSRCSTSRSHRALRSGFDFALVPGTTCFTVTSGFDNDDFGVWTMTIRGPGDILLPASGGAVPEPAIWALLIAGFGLVGHATRRCGFAAA